MIEKTERLKQGFIENSDRDIFDFSKIENPQFETRHMVHDWRNYVPEICQLLWDELSEETKIVLYALAEYEASNEEWE